MFSKKYLLFIVLSYLVSFYVSKLLSAPPEVRKPMIILGVIGLTLCFYLYTKWYFNRDKMVEKLVEIQEKKEIMSSLDKRMTPSISTKKTPYSPQKIQDKIFTEEQSAMIWKRLGIDRSNFNQQQFHQWMNIEKKYYTNVIWNEALAIWKVVLAHLHEFPDYYIRLEKMEAEAKEYWGK